MSCGSGHRVGDRDVFGKEVRTNGGFVLAGEFIGVIAVHKGRFSNTDIGSIMNGGVIIWMDLKSIIVFVATGCECDVSELRKKEIVIEGQKCFCQYQTLMPLSSLITSLVSIYCLF